MPQGQTMTLDEKLAVLNKAGSLWRAGKIEESERLSKTVPIPSYIAKIMKEKMGLDFLINGGWNLSEAEAEFGPSFFSK